jgi:hypothetical protein
MWTAIELPDRRALEYTSSATSQLDSLAGAWRSQRVRLEKRSPESLREFVTRLVRSWAIETGIIERLYDLDEGVTETLIEHGFRADLLNRGDSSAASTDLLAMLNDHVAAADMVRDVVAQGRPFGKHFVRELHQLLTRTQTQTEARTVDGTVVTLEMRHGEFKQLPNNPTRPDGSAYQYAPPEHVESEMDQLFEGLQLLAEESPVAVQAAWLHHRFTQIHPFQDGNGRVARALTNLVFIRAGLFPLVVNRRDRGRYIDALEAADAGDLAHLIDLFAEIESQTIIVALSVAVDEEAGGRTSTVQSVLGRMVSKFGAQLRDRESVLRGVNSLAVQLRDFGVESAQASARDVVEKMQATGVKLRMYSETGGPEFANDHFWRFQVVGIARDLGYWVNLQEDHYWFRVALEGMPVRFQYVVSFHHVGHELSGVMQAGAFAEFEAPRLPSAGETSEPPASERNTKNCTPRVFSVTWQSTFEAERNRFASWLDESLALALRYWMDLS